MTQPYCQARRSLPELVMNNRSFSKHVINSRTGTCERNDSIKSFHFKTFLCVEFHARFHGMTDTWPITYFSPQRELTVINSNGDLLFESDTCQVHSTHYTSDITRHKNVVGRQIWLLRRASDRTSPRQARSLSLCYRQIWRRTSSCGRVSVCCWQMANSHRGSPQL
jgi:hypothetical protein